MRKSIALLALLAALPAGLVAQDNMSMGKMDKMGHNPMVGGAAMLPTRNIIENAVNSKDHTTLVAAVKAAGLVKTLEGKGPFTVFAPTNEAFAELPSGTVDNLLKPANKATLQKVLTYHVVAGDWTVTRIEAALRRNKMGSDGKMGSMDKMGSKDKMATKDKMGSMDKMAASDPDVLALTTVEGGKIWLMKKDGHFWVKDAKGGIAEVTIADVMQSNGVIHVINKVLMPQ